VIAEQARVAGTEGGADGDAAPGLSCNFVEGEQCGHIVDGIADRHDVGPVFEMLPREARVMAGRGGEHGDITWNAGTGRHVADWGWIDTAGPSSGHNNVDLAGPAQILDNAPPDGAEPVHGNARPGR